MIGIEQVNASELRTALKVLRQVEPEGVQDLRRDLKSNLIGKANEVAKQIPSAPPMSGLGKNNKWGWQPKRGTVSFTPGKSRTNATSLVSIRVNYGDAQGYPFGVWIAEFAGSYSSGRSTSGQQLISRLNAIRPMKGRGGRFAYSEFRKMRPEVVNIAVRIINDTMKRLEKKIK